MNKFLELLEKHVEWIALAIGAVFLFAMGYFYIFRSPVTLPVDAAILRPGEMDDYIKEHSYDRLDKKIKDSHPVELQISKPDMGMESDGPAMPPFADTFDHQQYTFVKENDQKLGPAPNLVAVLPALPPAVPMDVESGRTTINAAVVAAPVAGAHAAAVAVAPPQVRVDKDWTTAFFSIPAQPFADQWDQCFGPPPAGGPPRVEPKETEFLVVQLIRQEKLPDGSWGPEKLIPRLSNQTLPAMPNQGTKAQNLGYASNMGQTHQLDIIAPPFYAQANNPSGDPWRDFSTWVAFVAAPPPAVNPVPGPGLVTPPAPAPTPAPAPHQHQPPHHGSGPAGGIPGVGSGFSPSGTGHPLAGDASGTDSGNGALQDYLRRQYGSGPGGANGGRPPGGAPPFPQQPQRPPVAPQQPPQTVIPPQQQVQPPVNPNVPLNPLAPQGPQAGAPTHSFDPSALTIDIPIYLHDDTVVPGSTYRYKLRYKIFNPLYLRGQAANANMAGQFTLDAPDSQWSKPVTIKPRTQFFCSTAQQPAGRFGFDVFTWSDGQWRSQKCTVSPGDAIGAAGTGKDEANFTTGWTLVDVRKENTSHGERTSVILVNDDGLIRVMDAQKDARGVEHDWMVEQGISLTPPTTPTGAVAGQ